MFANPTRCRFGIIPHLGSLSSLPVFVRRLCSPSSFTIFVHRLRSPSSLVTAHIKDATAHTIPIQHAHRMQQPTRMHHVTAQIAHVTSHATPIQHAQRMQQPTLRLKKPT